MKCNSISHAISDTMPHVWVINEMKSPLSAAHCLHLRDYNAFESSGVPASRGTSSKWGVIIGVKRNISAQQLQIDPCLRGRAVVVDIVVPSSLGRGFAHRLIGVYAPWDPGLDMAVMRVFWSQIAELCASSPHSWSLYGDCNATMSDCEVTTISPHRLANHECFQEFLCRTRGVDLWSGRMDCHALDLFTCQGTGTGKSIIDRVVHSSHGCLAGEVDIAPIFIGAIDH